MWSTNDYIIENGQGYHFDRWRSDKEHHEKRVRLDYEERQPAVNAEIPLAHDDNQFSLPPKRVIVTPNASRKTKWMTKVRRWLKSIL